jgi:DNA-directed RNA polymerase I, II, and III subunit RPABC2
MMEAEEMKAGKFEVLRTKYIPLRPLILELQSFSPRYDDEPEGEYDPDEPIEPFDPDEETHNAESTALADDQDNIVESGDPAAAANRTRGEKVPKDKKIQRNQRTTTPYMTKYERARVLGTRALQIR